MSPRGAQASKSPAASAHNPPLWILRDPPLDGPTNMARDEQLLYSESLRPAVLRLYQWSQPTLSLGYFQRAAEIDELPAELRRLAVVRRLTGGGAILHDLELTYCLALDQSEALARAGPAALYQAVHECWRDAMAIDGVVSSLAPNEFPLPSPRSGPFFCFEKPGRTDLLLGKGKVLGSAQRRIPCRRVLQHGSLILGRRFAAHPGAHLGSPPAKRVEEWTRRFVAQFAARLERSPRWVDWSDDQRAAADARIEKYRSDEWTRMR